MKIFRVEAEHGFGPYTEATCVQYHGEPTDTDRRSHPIPQNDIAKRTKAPSVKRFINHLKQNNIDDIKGTQILFGFNSISQLNNWFNDTELFLLEADGYLIMEYDIPDEHVNEFGHQVMFLNKGCTTPTVCDRIAS